MYPDKFIVNLSSDILKENYHLKSQLTALRKTFKQYQGKILLELEQAVKLLNIHVGSTLQISSEEALNKFIELVRQSMEKVVYYQENYETKVQENQKLVMQLQNKSQNIEANMLTILQLQTAIKQYKQKNQFLQEQFKIIKLQTQQDNQLSRKQIKRLNLELKTLDRTLNLKYIDEKNNIEERASRNLFQYRLNVESEFTKHEKMLRTQIDKKDKEIKGLLHTITNITNQKFNKKSSMQLTEPKIEQDQQLTNMLTKLMKPYIDHSQLLEKLSKLRKEASVCQKQNRELLTKLTYLQSRNKQLEDQLQTYKQKYEIGNRKYEDLYKQLESVSEKYEKNKKDLNAVEKYYEDKWSMEFSNVKYNLEKKLQVKIMGLEREYEERRKEMEVEMCRARSQVEIISKKLQIVQNINKNVQELNTKMVKNSIFQQTKIQEILQTAKQCQNLSNQDKQSLRYTLQLKLQEKQHKILSLSQTISQIDQQLDQSTRQHQSQMHKTQEKYQNMIEQIKNDHDALENFIINQKNREIGHLKDSVRECQGTIKIMKEEHDDEILRVRLFLVCEKEGIVRNLKMAHFSQLVKKNQTIQTLELQIQTLKQQFDRQYQQYSHSKQRYQQIIKQNQLKISQLQRSLNSSLFPQTIKQIDKKQKQIAKLTEKLESMGILENSRQLEIRNLEEEIEKLKGERDRWIDDVRKCKVEFRRGFQEVVEACDKRVHYYKQRILELQRAGDSGFINLRERQKIKSLMNQNSSLQKQLKQKQAQTLVIMHDKKYYQTRTQEAQSKIGLNFQLKQMIKYKQPIFIRKPRNNTEEKNKIKNLKTEIKKNNTDIAEWFLIHQKMKSRERQRQLQQQPHSHHKSVKDELQNKFNSPKFLKPKQSKGLTQNSKHYKTFSSLI